MNDLDLVLDGWDTLEPPTDFAERVIAATMPKRRSFLPIIGVAAVAAALVIAPFFLPHSHAASIAHVDDLDAGSRTD